MAVDEGAYCPRPFSPLPHLIATLACGLVILITGWLTAIMPDEAGRATLVGLSVAAAAFVIGWYAWNVNDYVRRHRSYAHRPDQATIVVVIGIQSAILAGCAVGAAYIFLRVLSKCL
jgi:hypothetical protein